MYPRLAFNSLQKKERKPRMTFELLRAAVLHVVLGSNTDLHVYIGKHSPN